ncbi:MAG: Fic family protein [Firmicutes bacterium]|nr:Fic family protein [Bacillota bacterium]
MYDTLDAKIEEYRRIGADNPELKRWIRESGLWYWLYGILRVRGVNISREQILSILAGELSEDLPLELYSYVHSWAALYADMQLSAGMQTLPDLKLLARWHSMLYGSDPQFRKRNPVVYVWGFVPCHFNDIGKQLTELFRENAHDGHKLHFMDRAIRLHMEFLRIYPFEEDNVSLAGALMLYTLLLEGIPAAGFTVGEEDYDILVRKYLSGEDENAFREMFLRSMEHRIESVTELCRKAKDGSF